jgi:hypothetical protein
VTVVELNKKNDFSKDTFSISVRKLKTELVLLKLIAVVKVLTEVLNRSYCLECPY